jgi:hypothetical protein
MKGKGTLISDLDAVVLRANSSPRWLDLISPNAQTLFCCLLLVLAFRDQEEEKNLA